MRVLSKEEKKGLPFVYINVATTTDGKLAPANRHFVPFSSKRDQRLLMELRTSADAVMAGSRTVDTGPVDLGPGGIEFRRKRVARGLAEYNLRVVVSRYGRLNPEAEIFRHRFSPIIVLTTGQASKARLKALGRVADELKIFGEDQLDVIEALRWLRQEKGVKRLLSEGGGELNAALFEAGVVDELYMTLSPWVFGGREAPTMADGEGVQGNEEAAPLRLKSCERVGDELFLVYRVKRSPA
jgi:riboflavin-specific deaminase-like protein